MLHEPPILFLDEPTSGVDPISRRRFWDLIAQLSQQGTTVFVTTHYMEEAEYCDELALIYRGRIIAQGAPKAVKTESMPEDILEIRVERPFEALEELEASGTWCARRPCSATRCTRWSDDAREARPPATIARQARLRGRIGRARSRPRSKTYSSR